MIWKVNLICCLLYTSEGNFGYNGSENFASGNRFGFFPAGAIGWIVSNEKFMGGVTPVSYTHLLNPKDNFSLCFFYLESEINFIILNLFRHAWKYIRYQALCDS